MMMGKTTQLARSERPYFDQVGLDGGMHECRKAINMRKKSEPYISALSRTAKQPPDRKLKPRNGRPIILGRKYGDLPWD